MNGLKKFLYYFTGFVAICTFIQLPYAFATSSVLGKPQTIDTALKESGAYERFIPLTLDQIADDAKNPDAQKLVKEQGVRDAITSAVKTSDIEASGQSIINGVYAWLEGKTKLPEFTIDLSKSRDDLVKNLAAYAEKRSSTLPACTLEQLRTLNLNDDLLSIPCLPPGVAPAQIGQQFSDQALNQIDFLKDPVVTRQTLMKDQDVAKAEQDTKDVPKLYRGLHDSKWVVLVFALVLAALLIFARKDRIAGVRYVSKILLVLGIVIGIFSLLFMTIGVNEVSSTNEIGEVMGRAVVSILKKINAMTVWFALGYVVVGGGALLFLRRRFPPVKSDPVAPNGPVTTR